MSTTGTVERVTLPPAPAGRRIAARLIDVLVFQVPLITIAVVLGALFGLAAHFGDDRGRQDAYQTAALISLGVTAFAWLLPSVLPEALFRTTPGKALLGLRVIRPDGRRPALWQALVRNLPFVPLMSLIWIGLETYVWLMLVQLTVIGACAAALGEHGSGFHDRLAGGTVVVRKLAAEALPVWGAPGGHLPAAAGRPARRRDPVRVVGLVIVLFFGLGALKSCLAPGTFLGWHLDDTTTEQVPPTVPGLPAGLRREPFLDRLLRTGQRLSSSGDDDGDLRDRLCDQVDRASEQVYDVSPALSSAAVEGVNQASFDCVFEPRRAGRRLVLVVSVERGAG